MPLRWRRHYQIWLSARRVPRPKRKTLGYHSHGAYRIALHTQFGIRSLFKKIVPICGAIGYGSTIQTSNSAAAQDSSVTAEQTTHLGTIAQLQQNGRMKILGILAEGDATANSYLCLILVPGISYRLWCTALIWAVPC